MTVDDGVKEFRVDLPFLDPTNLPVPVSGHGHQRPAVLRLHGRPAHGDPDHSHGAAVHPGGPGRRGPAHQAGTQGETRHTTP